MFLSSCTELNGMSFPYQRKTEELPSLFILVYMCKTCKRTFTYTCKLHKEYQQYKCLIKKSSCLIKVFEKLLLSKINIYGFVLPLFYKCLSFYSLSLYSFQQLHTGLLKMIVLENFKIKRQICYCLVCKVLHFQSGWNYICLVMFDRISNTKPKVFIRNQEFLVLLDLQGISIFDNRLLPWFGLRNRFLFCSLNEICQELVSLLAFK